MKKEYALVTRIPILMTYLAICIVGLLTALVPGIFHSEINSTLTIQALGPCFYCKGCNSHNQRFDNPLDPEKYSGYSIIVDTVWTDRVKGITADQNIPETMMINGKEYILK